MGFSLRMEEASGSSSRTDPLAGRSHICSVACVGSGSIFMAGSGAELSSIAEDLILVLSGAGSKIADIDATCAAESKIVLLSLMASM